MSKRAIVPSSSGLQLTAQALSVRRGQREVISSIDLVAEPGQLLALIGPNGAGKSTLLAALAGDLPASGGRILFGGGELKAMRPKELARQRAVLPQSLTVSFPFTARQIVAMGRAPWSGTDRDLDDDSVIDDALATMEAGHLAGRTFSTLSGGERALVVMAKTLAQQVPVLLLDEPTAALDLQHQERLLHVAKSRAKAGDTVVVVLHDLGLAAAHADRIAVLKDGRLVTIGDAQETLTGEVLSVVYQHPVEVIPHPRTGELLVLPLR